MNSNVCLMMTYIHKVYLFIFNNTTIFMYVYNLYALIKYIRTYTYMLISYYWPFHTIVANAVGGVGESEIKIIDMRV